MATYDSPAAAADKVKMIDVAAEVGIQEERVLELCDILETVNGVSGPWTTGLWSANVPTEKEMAAVLTNRLARYDEEASRLMAQMQIADVGLVFSLV